MIVQILIGFQDVGAVANRARHEVEALLQAGNNVTVISDAHSTDPVSYTHLRAHETVLDLVCRLLLEKKNNNTVI